MVFLYSPHFEENELNWKAINVSCVHNIVVITNVLIVTNRIQSDRRGWY